MQMILFIGIPGSGKSTFYQQHFSHSHLRVNMDMLRTRNRENKLLRFCFETHMRLVVDNTNVRVDDRKAYIELARQHRYQVIGYYFQSNVKECLERNARRPGKQQIIEKGLLAKFHQLQPPSWGEGFDELYHVSIVENTFMIRPWQSKTVRPESDGQKNESTD